MVGLIWPRCSGRTRSSPDHPNRVRAGVRRRVKRRAAVASTLHARWGGADVGSCRFSELNRQANVANCGYRCSMAWLLDIVLGSACAGMTASRPAGQFTRERSRRFQPSGPCELSFRYKPLLVSPQEVDPHDDGGHSDYAYNNSDPVTHPMDQISKEIQRERTS